MLCGDALSFNKAFDRSRKQFVTGIPTTHLEPLGVTVPTFKYMEGGQRLVLTEVV